MPIALRLDARSPPGKGRAWAEMPRPRGARTLSVCLSDRVCGSVWAAAQEAPHQVGGHGAYLELVHDVGAVRLYRLDADVQVAGNLPVQADGRDSWYYAFRVAPVAQLDRVLGYEPRGRGFESCRARHPFKGLNSKRIQALFLCPQAGHMKPSRKRACVPGQKCPDPVGSGRCLSVLVCGSVRAAAQEAAHQVGHGADLELVHDVGAVRLHHLDADVQVAGNLPVQAAGCDSWYYAFRVAPVAQLDRVLGYEPRGRGFESCRARHPFQGLN